MIEYKLLHEKDCESCCAEGVPLAEFERRQAPVNSGATKYICEVCASTNIGTITDYTKQYELDTIELARVIGNVTNLLLKEIRELKERRDD